MDPSKEAPRGNTPAWVQDNNRDNTVTTATNPSQYDLADSLSRLTLANAAATPLPPSPSSSSRDVSQRPSPPIAIEVEHAPTQIHASSSSSTSLRDAHDRTVPILQKRPSTSSLRSVSQPAAPKITSPHAPSPKRTPSFTSLRDERRKSIPSLQKRPSATSLRSTAPPPIPVSSSRRSPTSYPTSPTPTSPAMASRQETSPPEAQAPTAASVAAEHFQKEMELHQIVDLKSNTIVVIHDDCYGHRYSRPRTQKTHLASIVERPERIRACVRGISAAFVLMGRRYEGECFAIRPDLDLSALPPPPFQIRKTSRSLPLNDTAVTNVHGTQWMADLKTMCDDAESHLARGDPELVRPAPMGNEGTTNMPELHTGDLYLCAESLDAIQGALGGVCDGIDAVFNQGPTTRAFVCIRPPGHHCSADYPSGFCWVNNVLVGTSYAAINHGLTHAAILDFDLHHGDGSQEIVWNHNSQVQKPGRSTAYKKTAIGYYSLHDINSYPCEDGPPEKTRNASVCIDGSHGQSIWNVHLETWETEAEFWELYRAKYMILIDKARNFLRVQSQRLARTPGGPTPKAAIFISAGFDASEWEGTGMQRHSVYVPTEFYARFTADVVRMSQEEGLGVDGRVISVLEGGYSDRALTSGVLSHLAGLGDAHPSLDRSASTGMKYESKWWSEDHLNELEALTSPQIHIKREMAGPTFLASTKAFDAKVLSTTRDRKPSGPSTPGTTPLPEVNWATATHELTKVLTPDGSRQTMSNRFEDLNAEATRRRRLRQLALEGVNIPALPTPTPPREERRQLRVRKAKSPAPSSGVATPRLQTLPNHRRRTLDGGDLTETSGEVSPSVGASRRKNTAIPSTISTEPISLSRAGEFLLAPASTATPRKAVGGRKMTGRGDTPRRASPRKEPPVPKVPSAYLEQTSEAVADKEPVRETSAVMQRLKLTMPSPEEQAAREKKRVEMEELAAANSKPQ